MEYISCGTSINANVASDKTTIIARLRAFTTINFNGPDRQV